MNDFKIVYVMWEDSSACEGWIKKDAFRNKSSLVETIGYLIERNENSLIIASSQSDTDTLFGVLTIPYKSIIDCYVIVKWQMSSIDDN